jgi:hypothetical protein
VKNNSRIKSAPTIWQPFWGQFIFEAKNKNNILSSFGFISKALFSIDFENWKRRYYFMVDLDF